MNETFELVIRSLPPTQHIDAPVEVRLRTALKFLLRATGFRCYSIRPQDPEFADGDGI